MRGRNEVVAEMSFLPELGKFLVENGLIYTVRKYRVVEGDVGVVGVGWCHRIPLGEVFTKENLSPYVEFSGFSSIESWWSKIMHFIPSGSSPKYLYKVAR